MLAIMSVGWIVQRVSGNAGWIDVFWTFGTGATCAAAALVPTTAALPSLRQILVAVLVAAWSIRLGVYIARRVATGAEDVRYTALKREWGERFQLRALGLMLIQAPVTALLAVSVLLAARNPEPGLGFQDLAGLAVLILAVLGEGAADEQMRRFKADPANRGRVCDTGLWAWSRHPNYLFEFLSWFAYPVIAFRASDPWSLLALAAPFMMFLVLRFGTGVPPLEAAMVESRGDAYRRYQARVSPFLPRPPKSAPYKETAV
jgi:steroid 5-alpha reductase family enzyme